MTAGAPGPGRWRTAAAVVRIVLSVGMLLTVYYQAPLDRRVDVQVLVWLGLGLAGLGAALTWQVRSILISDAPRLRAAETAAVGLPVLLLLYASAYGVVSLQDPPSFTQRLGRTDALYFAMTVFTTVGFGDISPVSELARVLTMTQMVVGLVAVGVVARLLLGAVRVAVDRRAAEGTTSRTPSRIGGGGPDDEQRGAADDPGPDGRPSGPRGPAPPGDGTAEPDRAAARRLDPAD